MGVRKAIRQLSYIQYPARLEPTHKRIQGKDNGKIIEHRSAIRLIGPDFAGSRKRTTQAHSGHSSGDSYQELRSIKLNPNSPTEANREPDNGIYDPEPGLFYIGDPGRPLGARFKRLY